MRPSGDRPVLDSIVIEMEKQPFLQELQDRLGELFRSSPAADVERNLEALLSQAFQRMELVTRDEFDTFAEVLSALHARVGALEETIARLERGRDGSAGAAPSPDSPSGAPGRDATGA